jgi:hypothetical protein
VAPDAGGSDGSSPAHGRDADGDDGDDDDDDGDGDDDGPERCRDADDCREGRRSLCHPERNVCVACVSDEDCGDDEHCEHDAGECDD